jgi:tetratricopeptide (TPR) repeat protein
MEYRNRMNPPVQTLARRTPLVLAALIATAVLGFSAVSHLVTRLKANEKSIAYHAYEAGMAAYQRNDRERALDDFRAALTYDRDNPSYQLSLARALRDTGRLDESEAYLVHLWEGSPQDSTINLALARLAARRHSVDDALRYYHSAIYGVWPADPDRNRRQTRLELIDFLLEQKAFPQARVELMALTQVLPPDSAAHLAVANRFREAQDLPSALTQYEVTLKLAPNDADALAGAGEAAFELGRYTTAEKYLKKAAVLNSTNDQIRQQWESATLILATDPFLHKLSDAERNRRLVAAFTHAGERLKTCSEQLQIALPAPASVNRVPAFTPAPTTDSLPDLWNRWNAAHSALHQLNSASNTDLPDMVMDLVTQIEQQTARQCGQPGGTDLALLLISRDREAVNQ